MNDPFAAVGTRRIILGLLLGGLLVLAYSVLQLFLYRDCETLLAQFRQVLRRFVGSRIEGCLSAVGATTKAVVYGLMLTALAQGTLAGLGCWVAGVHAPELLAVLTPFDAPFVWGFIGVWLLLNSQTAAGVG